MQLSPVNIEQRKKMDIKPGDTIRVWQRVQEGKKTRTQAFEGLVISRKKGTENGATFTVRKISHSIGVELIFPLYSPKMEKIELISRPKRVRRAKLYYLRERAARQVKKKMKQLRQVGEVMLEKKTEETDVEKDAEKTEEKKEGQKTEEIS